MRVLAFLAQPWTAWAVLILLAFAYGSAGESPLQAIGPALLWAGISFICRLIVRSRLGSFVPRNQPMPSAQLAVSVTPSCPPEACPGVPAMKESLPENVRQLLG